MRMRFQSRKSEDTSDEFPAKHGNPTRRFLVCLSQLWLSFSLFRFSARFSLYYISKRALTPRRTARDVHTHTHTSTSTTLDRLVRQHRTTHFESFDSATERFCEPSIETLSRARTRAAGGLNRHSPRFFNNAKPKPNARALGVSDVSFSPSSTWARTRLHRSRFPT